MAKKSGSKNPAVAFAALALEAAKRPGRGSDQFIVRLPDGMRDLIAEMAEQNGRSMNAEIINALAHQIARFSPGKPLTPGIIEVMNDVTVERIRQGEIQRSVREMGHQLEVLARELDQVASESRALVGKPLEKKNPPVRHER